MKAYDITSEEIYARGHEKRAKKRSIPVDQYDTNGNFINHWESYKDAGAALRFNPSNLSAYLSSLVRNQKGKRVIAGYLWARTSEELKMALERYNDNKWKRFRPVGQFDLNGQLLKIYPSAAEAYRQTGVLASHIRLVCNKNRPRNVSAGGYGWKYMDEEN